MPNLETKVLLVQIFGEKGHPVRKYQRIMYWFPKFKELNPWPIPKDLPTDPVDLARFSLTRIADDLDAQVTVYQVPPFLYIHIRVYVYIHTHIYERDILITCYLTPDLVFFMIFPPGSTYRCYRKRRACHSSAYSR